MGTNQRITFSANSRSCWWLLHLQVGIDRLAASSELTGNAGHLDLFVHEIVNGLGAFDPLVMEVPTLFFQAFSHCGVPGNWLW